jgi:hypothetical protein
MGINADDAVGDALEAVDGAIATTEEYFAAHTHIPRDELFDDTSDTTLAAADDGLPGRLGGDELTSFQNLIDRLLAEEHKNVGSLQSGKFNLFQVAILRPGPHGKASSIYFYCQHHRQLADDWESGKLATPAAFEARASELARRIEVVPHNSLAKVDKAAAATAAATKAATDLAAKQAEAHRKAAALAKCAC